MTFSAFSAENFAVIGTFLEERYYIAEHVYSDNDVNDRSGYTVVPVEDSQDGHDQDEEDEMGESNEWREQECGIKISYQASA